MDRIHHTDLVSGSEECLFASREFLTRVRLREGHAEELIERAHISIGRSRELIQTADELFRQEYERFGLRRPEF